MPVSHFSGHNLWILKLVSLNRGRGIHVFNSLQQLKDLINDYTQQVKIESKSKPMKCGVATATQSALSVNEGEGIQNPLSSEVQKSADQIEGQLPVVSQAEEMNEDDMSGGEDLEGTLNAKTMREKC